MKKLFVELALTVVAMLFPVASLAERESVAKPDAGGRGMSQITVAKLAEPEMVAKPVGNKLPYSICAGCHGAKGDSSGKTVPGLVAGDVIMTLPSLASQPKAFIVEAMRQFKTGQRQSTIMGQLAKSYTDADFEAMGEFFSNQKLHTTDQVTDKAKVALGAELHEQHCARCHLEDGREGKDDTPVVASQWLPYMQVQMVLYHLGKRKMPEKMAEKVKKLSKDELDALLNFYASVR